MSEMVQMTLKVDGMACGMCEAHINDAIRSHFAVKKVSSSHTKGETGLVAKENIVGTLGVLYSGGAGTVYDAIAAAFNGITGYSFLVFNLLCAPCFAAIGAIKREMNNAKWTWFAIGYQCGFAYAVALMINQFGGLFTGNANIIGVIAAVIVLAAIIYMLVRPYKEATKLTTKVEM